MTYYTTGRFCLSFGRLHSPCWRGGGGGERIRGRGGGGGQRRQEYVVYASRIVAGGIGWMGCIISSEATRQIVQHSSNGSTAVLRSRQMAPPALLLTSYDINSVAECMYCMHLLQHFVRKILDVVCKSLL